MGGVARQTKLKIPVDVVHYDPPTELRINAKKFKGFEKHRVGDKLNFSGNAEVHHVDEGKDYHNVVLHIKRLDKSK